MNENEEIKLLEEELRALRDALATLQFDRTLATSTASIAKFNKDIQNTRSTISDLYKKIEEAKKQQDEINKSQKRYSESIDKATGVIEDFRAGVMNADFSFNNYSKTLNSASKGLTEAVGGALSFTAAAFGYTKVAATLEVATKSATVALQKFSEHLLNQAGSMLEAFDSIASIGGASTLTSSEIEQFGRNANFSGEALKFFGKLTKEQGSNLTAFGGSVGKGVESFSEFITLTAEQRKQYRLLGISQNQLAEYQSFYSDNLLKSGMSIDRGVDGMMKLRQSSLEYRDILMALSNISGDTLEEQQKALDFQAQNANFQATLAQKDIERVKLLEEAEKLEAGAAKDALLAEAKKIEDQAELMKLMALEYSPDKVGVENATAMLEMLATGGEAVTENTVAFDMLNPAIRDTVRELSNFSGDSVEQAVKDLILPSKKAFTDAVDQQLAALGPMAGLLGKEILSVWGISTEGIAESARLRQTTVENMIAAYEEAIERDKATEALVAFTNALYEFGLEMREKFSEFFAGFLGPDGILPSLTGGVESFTNLLKEKSAGLVVGLTLFGGAILGAAKAFGVGKLAGAVTRGGQSSIANRTALERESTIERRVDRRGREYYTDTSIGRRVSNTAGEEALRRRENARVRSRGIRGGIGGILGGLALGYAGDELEERGHTTAAAGVDVASSALSYGSTGAMLGSFFGPAGTLIGGGLGAAGGAAYGLWQNRDRLFGDQENEEAITDSFNEVASSTSSLARTFDNFNEDNSFDDLVTTTDSLIEAFGTLTATVNTSSTSNRSSRSFDSGTSSANMQTASITPRVTTRSFDSGTNISEQETKDFIIGNEGIRYEPYEDTRGNWTVGVGHLIGNNLPPEMNRRFSHQEVMDLFDSDYMHHRTAAERISGFNRMDGLGQTALTDLTFNMGPSWINGWPNLSKQLGEGDISTAADNLRSSRWYDQVGNRGPRVANMLENSTMISAARGGIAQGPETGYLGKLHGTELIQPINSDSVLSKLATTPESNSDFNINSNEIQTRMSEMYKSNMMLVETLNSKLDSMISKLEDSNYIQERILSNTV